MQLHKRQKLRAQCDAALAELRRRCARRAALMSCDVHQRTAVVRVSGDSLANARFEIEACCPVFAARVRDALQQDR